MGEKMPTAGKKKILLRIAGIAVALIFAGGAGAGLRWLTASHKKAEKPLVEQVQDLRMSGNEAETNKKINDALSKPSTSAADRYLLYIQQGSAYEDQKNVTAAVDSYKKALAIKETFEVTNLLGNAYKTLGNKEMAITYYKKAILLMKQDGNPLYDEDKAALEYTIKALGGQP